jgi:hypothetical protein
VTYELEGVLRNDKGAPMFDSFGQRCVGIAELLNNEAQNGTGTCTFTDGLAGITGSGEYLNPNLPIKADDKALRGVVAHKMTWKLP